MRTASFSLVKWYLDCISDEGDAAVLYCADLHWRGLRATMGSVLESRPGEEPRTRSSLGRYRLSSTPEEIVVEHSRLKFAGRWQSACPPMQRTVYEEPGGSIVWNCIQPASRVTMRLGERELHGLGYAECLTLTLSPLHLPLSRLRWGRFVSPDHSLAWIDWEGKHSTRFAVFDGRQRELVSVSNSVVVIDGARLQIEEGLSLRSGRLRSTILPGAPGLKRFFPNPLFNVREQKWKSPATLVLSGQGSRGWVIREVVDWEL